MAQFSRHFWGLFSELVRMAIVGWQIDYYAYN